MKTHSYIKKFLENLNYHLVTTRYTLLLITIFYILFLKASTITYCSCFDNSNAFWSFPLEQQEAQKSWQEDPSDHVIIERWLHLDEYKHRIEEQHKMEYEDKRTQRLMEQNKSKVVQPNPSENVDEITFLKRIKTLPKEEQASAISERIYNKITTVIENTPQRKLNTPFIKHSILNIIKTDCTYNLWVSNSEAELKADSSMVNYILHIFYHGYKHSNLNNAEKTLALHITTILQIVNAAHVNNADNVEAFLDNESFYNDMYKANSLTVKNTS